jgi:hypothetical protein
MWPPLFHPMLGTASATTRRGVSVETRTPPPWSGCGSSAEAPCRRGGWQKAMLLPAVEITQYSLTLIDVILVDIKQRTS